MNKFIIFLLAAVLNASVVSDFLNKNYQKVCTFSQIRQNANNPKILSIIGKACLETDRIYLLPYIIPKLKKPSFIRKNALVFLTAVMEKRVLYSYLFDGIDLQSFCFPKIDYVLSDVFWALKNKKYQKNGDIYVIKTKDGVFKLYKKEDKMFLDEYKNGKLIKRRWYR